MGPAEAPGSNWTGYSHAGYVFAPAPQEQARLKVAAIGDQARGTDTLSMHTFSALYQAFRPSSSRSNDAPPQYVAASTGAPIADAQTGASLEKQAEEKQAWLRPEQAHELFWRHLRAGDVLGVSSVLDALPARERRALAQAPHGGHLEALRTSQPQRPLCVAAYHGSREMCAVLLKPPGAHPWLGDKCEGSRSLSALFWATASGRTDIMSDLHDAHGLDAKDALLAIDLNPSRANILWLQARGLTASGFTETMMKAIDVQNVDIIRSLIRFARVSPNQSVWFHYKQTDDRLSSVYEEPVGRLAMGQSILCWAIATNKMDSARLLIDEGAGVNGESGDKERLVPCWSNRPVCLTMRRVAAAGTKDAASNILIELLRAKAWVDHDHLLLAMDFTKPSGTRLFKTLFLHSDIAPTGLSLANSLLREARDNQLFSVQVILAELIVMLHEGVTWSDSEAKAKEPHFAFVAYSRQRIFEYVSMDDEDVEPDLLEELGGWGPCGDASANFNLSLRRTDQKRGMGLLRERLAAAIPFASPRRA